MSGKHPIHVKALEAIQRIGCHFLIEGERGRLRSFHTREDMARGEGVAHKQGFDGWEVDRDAPGTVTGNVDDLGTAGKLERSVSGQFGDLPYWWHLHPAASRRVPNETEDRPNPESPPRRILLGSLSPRLGCICSVDIYGDVVFGTKSLRNPEMITVAVGENQSSDIIEAPAHQLQFFSQLSPVPGKSRIDHCDSGLIPDQVAGHDVRPDPVEVWCNLHASYRGGGSRESTAVAQSSGSTTTDGRLIRRR